MPKQHSQKNTDVSKLPSSKPPRQSVRQNPTQEELERLVQRLQADPHSVTSQEAIHLQRMVGNQAIGQFIAQAPKPEIGSTGQAVIQRMIGQGGNDLVGKLAKKGNGAPWKIINAREGSSGWEYELDMKGLMQKWVQGNDEEWNIYEEPLDEETIELGKTIDKLKVGGVNKIDSWEDVESISVAQSEMSTTTPKAPIIWSGGAEDCIVVASVVGKTGYLAHVDRLSQNDGRSIISKGRAGRVFFASKIFMQSGDKAAQNGNVKYLMGVCKLMGVAPVLFGSDRLALDARNGSISTQFDPP